MFLLGDSDNPTGQPGSSIACGLAKLVSSLSKVGVNHNSAANDGVLADERDHGVSDVQLSAASLGSHVPEIPGVSHSLAVLRSPVLTLVRVEVGPGTGAAVSVVSELVNMKTMQTVREARDLSRDLDWTRALLLEVNSSSHLTGPLENTHSLHHCDSREY